MVECKKKNTLIVHIMYPPGRQPILTEFEKSLICQRMRFVTSREFATGYDILKIIAGKIAGDERVSLKNGYLSDDWVGAFRSRHPDEVIFCKVENKNVSQILAEHPDHVETLARALKECQKRHPSI